MSFFSGLGVTALLQSSTATALLAISFAKKGLLPLTLALALMIGADISTTLVAQVFTFDLSWLSPAVLAFGILIYLSSSDHTYRRNIGRIFIGLGLMLLSLGLIREAADPLKNSALLPTIIEPLANDPFFAILVSAILTYAIHSSLAAVLLFGTFAANGFIDLELGLLLIFGANLGGAMIPFIVTFKDSPIARQIAIGNIIMRFVTLVLGLVFFQYILDYLATSSVPLERQLMNVHTGFNVVLAIIFMPLVSYVAIICEKIISNTDHTEDKYKPDYLDRGALDTPAAAMANAKREALRMAEIVEEMLEQSLECFSQNKQDLINEIRLTDHQVDALYREIKLYMTELSARGINEEESETYFHILTFVTNLEHIGDIIDKSLMELAQKRIRKQERFSDEGYKEIKELHALVLSNMKLAQNIFISEDVKLADKLAKGKAEVRHICDDSFAKHFKRLEKGAIETVQTSSMHLDIIRDLRQINNYSTRIAYLILDEERASIINY